jgi:hypothetical protein
MGALVVGAASAAAAHPPVLAPSRCQATGATISVEGADVEVSDAVAVDSGVAVGLARRTGEGRTAGVAFVGRDVATASAAPEPGRPPEGRVRVVDVGPTLGDAPGPRLAVRGADVLVASYGLGGQASARELRVSAVNPEGVRRPVVAVAEARDDSLAFDLTSELLAWDEVTSDAKDRRGVVRVAKLFGDRAGVPRDVSPAESDAEMPRLAGTATAAFVLWLARSPEVATMSDGAAGGDAGAARSKRADPNENEAIGEVRSTSWLEMVMVDAAGSPVGGVRRLTPTTGHVSAYDVRLLPGGRPTALVVARDNGESVDGSGGTLLRIRIGPDAAEAPQVLAVDGLGRGAPALVDAQDPWLVWANSNEELRLLPLDATGMPLGSPSAEGVLGEAWPLAVVGAEDAGAARSKRADPNENAGAARSKRADPNENAGAARSKRADPNENAGAARSARMLVAVPATGGRAAELRLVACVHPSLEGRGATPEPSAP